MIFIIFAVVHLLINSFMFFGILSGKIRLQKYMLIISLLLPLWGAILVMILHFELGFDPHAAAEINTEKMSLETGIYKNISVDDKRSDKTVPIEEALLINSGIPILGSVEEK